MSFTRLAAAAVIVSAIGLSVSGCSSAAKALGMSKVTPDEFRVITKPPLTVPPDFALRPPSPGEPIPPELGSESAARLALLGARSNTPRSAGEADLVHRAGGDTADVMARDRVDNDFGDIAHKDPSFADRVMFWRKGKPETQGPKPLPGATTPAPIDPKAEAERLEALTGGKQVTIEQNPPSGGRIKLPGL